MSVTSVSVRQIYCIRVRVRQWSPSIQWNRVGSVASALAYASDGFRRLELIASVVATSLTLRVPTRRTSLCTTYGQRFARVGEGFRGYYETSQEHFRAYGSFYGKSGEREQIVVVRAHRPLESTGCLVPSAPSSLLGCRAVQTGRIGGRSYDAFELVLEKGFGECQFLGRFPTAHHVERPSCCVRLIR